MRCLSGTSAAYALLAQLGKTDARYAEAATKILARMADKIQVAPAAWASLTAYAALYGQPAEAKPEMALDSAAHVKAAAHGASHADHDEIVVTLTIDPSYHVNANPASADYLMPTVGHHPGRARRQDHLSRGRNLQAEILARGDFGL